MSLHLDIEVDKGLKHVLDRSYRIASVFCGGAERGRNRHSSS